VDTFEDRLRAGVLLADGAMGTRLRTFLPPETLEQPLELLNLTRPELVQHVHREYMDAGAGILTANSYSASSVVLASRGLADSMEAINRRAVELARAVADSAARPVFVAASVGPLGAARYSSDTIRLSQMEAVFDRQIGILVEAGVDAIFIETMDEYREALAATTAARRYNVPVVTHLVSEDGHTLGAHVDLYSAIRKIEELGVLAIGLNCRIGPDAMLSVARRVGRYAGTPLSLQPNAGNLQVDGYGRMEILGLPEDFEAFARAAPDLGVRILGGCCHTTPAHIAALRSGLASRETSASAGPGATDTPNSTARVTRAPAEPAERPKTGPRPPSGLAERFGRGKFVLCVEIDPPTDDEVQADPGVLSYKVDGARYLEERCGIDVVTVADHTMGRPWLDGLPFAETLRPHLKSAEILLHYSCRNKAETDITGNFASFKLYGYRNILIITGDHPPSSECFYQYSSPTLIQRVRKEHGDYFFLSCSFDHNRGRTREGDGGLDGEIKRLMRKVAAGAQIALTQPIYSAERLIRLREKTAELGVPVLPGIMPILSVRHAETVNQFPGIVVPGSVMERLAEAGEDRRERARVSVEIASETARAVREAGFPGIYLITPMNRFDVIQKVLSAIR
jgi:methionine synthase / methylenetetrahydrofolate reductase(NADPH)